ncbi:DUF2500 domain-containing protein [Dethiothermospora halolimnae]|uniref:DUF2500 domain-containing protein n=1 Tax=Dethiothermospora halolimnae TaxID=3114390 RepID=UPI003CCBB9A2
MFGGLPPFFGIIFMMIIIIVIINIVKGVSEWHNNNQQPVLTVDAKVVSKRSHVSRHSHNHDGHVHNTRSTTYYITFEFDSNDRVELKVPSNKYGYIVEGDKGKLTFQGTRFHDFKRI